MDKEKLQDIVSYQVHSMIEEAGWYYEVRATIGDPIYFFEVEINQYKNYRPGLYVPFVINGVKVKLTHLSYSDK
jgi:hypothetical protein